MIASNTFKGVLCARRYSKSSAYTDSSNFSKNPMTTGQSILSILQMKKVRHREENQLAHRLWLISSKEEYESRYSDSRYYVFKHNGM